MCLVWLAMDDSQQEECAEVEENHPGYDHDHDGGVDDGDVGSGVDDDDGDGGVDVVVDIRMIRSGEIKREGTEEKVYLTSM